MNIPYTARCVLHGLKVHCVYSYVECVRVRSVFFALCVSLPLSVLIFRSQTIECIYCHRRTNTPTFFCFIFNNVENSNVFISCCVFKHVYSVYVDIFASRTLVFLFALSLSLALLQLQWKWCATQCTRTHTLVLVSAHTCMHSRNGLSHREYFLILNCTRRVSYRNR